MLRRVMVTSSIGAALLAAGLLLGRTPEPPADLATPGARHDDAPAKTRARDASRRRVGPARVVRGFVTDMAGEPVAGVTVAAKGGGMTQGSATTDGGGAFRIVVPTTALAIEADGGRSGRDRAVVEAGEGERVVELVLEPAGYLRIVQSDPDDPEAHVRVCLWDGDARDGSGASPPNEPAAEGADGDEEHPYTAESASFAMRAFLAQAFPTLVPEGAAALDPAAYARAFEAKVRAAPAAVRAKLSAVIPLERGLAILRAEGPAAVPAPEGVPPDEAFAPTLVRTPEGGWELPASGAAGPSVARANEPMPHVPSDADRLETAAEGALGETFSLPAGRWYEAYVERADGTETPCGRIYLEAGDDVALACGGEDLTSLVQGRVVDGRGAPLPEVELRYTATHASGPELDRDGVARSGPDGRFRFELRHDRALEVTLAVASEAGVEVVRRNLSLPAGSMRDLGDLRVPGWQGSTDGVAGIGGRLALAADGARLVALDPESPLSLAGAEPGDTIIAIDGAPAAELPLAEIVSRLRGAPGTKVGLRLRDGAGALYELTLERVARLASEPEVASNPFDRDL